MSEAALFSKYEISRNSKNEPVAKLTYTTPMPVPSLASEPGEEGYGRKRFEEYSREQLKEVIQNMQRAKMNTDVPDAALKDLGEQSKELKTMRAPGPAPHH
jgi:hypothetical protein